MSETGKPYIVCHCSNPSVSQNKERCACGLYFRKVMDCSICGITHKVRPESFCKALYEGTINDPATKAGIVYDVISQRNLEITDTEYDEFNQNIIKQIESC